jgi:hypothetical protein
MSADVRIGFRGHHVVVRADDELVAGRIAASFRELPATGTPRTVERLTVTGSDRLHRILVEDRVVYSNESLRLVRRMLRHEVIRSFVRAHPDLLWLHAGAAVRDGAAILFCGPFGRGKSTLVAELCARGWHYSSDDIAPIDFTTACVLPFPLRPTRRVPVDEELPHHRVQELRRVHVPVDPARIQREPAAIAGVVLPGYRLGSGAAAGTVAPAQTALGIVQEALNASVNPLQTVAFCARLVSEVRMLPLTYSDPVAAVDVVLQAFGLAGGQLAATGT